MALLTKNYRLLKGRIKRPGDIHEKPVVIGIRGDAGMGKSRLVHEFTRDKSDFSLRGAASPLSPTPHSLFTSMMRDYFNISQIDSRKTIKAKLEDGFVSLAANVEKVEGEMLRDALPMIGHLLGIRYDDIRLRLPARELQPHLQTATRHFLEAAASRINASGVPLIVIFEDLHWVDEVSESTIEILMQTLNLDARRQKKKIRHIMFLFLHRPIYEFPGEVGFGADVTMIDLKPLTEKQAGVLIQSMTDQVELPQNVKGRLMKKSEGNPFYLEEWVNMVQSSPDPGELPIPDTLQALVLSRIDSLDKELRLLLQKAAVIGREFFVRILEEVEKKLNNGDDITRGLQILETTGFLRKNPQARYSSYIFKHIITQEVAYNTLLVANRNTLHRIVAEVIEEQFPDNLDDYHYDLAEHYSRAEISEKALEYLEKSSQTARSGFQNERAIQFCDRFLDILPSVSMNDEVKSKRRVDILLEKFSVLHLIGKWNLAEETVKEALEISIRINDRTRMGKANRFMGLFHSSKANFDMALEYYSKSLMIERELGNRAGIEKLMGNMGTVYHQTGDYEKAMECYEHQMKAAEELGNKSGLSTVAGNIGLLYIVNCQYDKAIEYLSEKLKLVRELSDKYGIASTLGYLGVAYQRKGDYDKAMELYKVCLENSEELGDRRKILIAVGNMGLHYADIGDFHHAIECYERNIKVAGEMGDTQILSLTLGNLGLVHKARGDHDRALDCFDRAIEGHSKMGYPYGLAHWLFAKAEVLFSLKTYDESKKYAIKSMRISKELNKSDLLFLNRVLVASIDFSLSTDDRYIKQLEQLLDTTEKEEERATLFHALALMNAKLKRNEATNRYVDKALALFRELYARTPKHNYKERIEELERGDPSGFNANGIS